jgi:hypothetical protein
MKDDLTNQPPDPSRSNIIPAIGGCGLLFGSLVCITTIPFTFILALAMGMGTGSGYVSAADIKLYGSIFIVLFIVLVLSAIFSMVAGISGVILLIVWAIKNLRNNPKQIPNQALMVPPDSGPINENPLQTEPQSPRSSKIGIAALVIWLLSLTLTCILFGISWLPFVANSSSSLSTQLQSALSLLAAGSCLLTPVAFILGLIGIFQKGTRKTIAIIGALGSGMTMLCILIWFLIVILMFR